jgi:hypothetical protein
VTDLEHGICLTISCWEAANWSLPVFVQLQKAAPLRARPAI